jgi:hypothetical protein
MGYLAYSASDLIASLPKYVFFARLSHLVFHQVNEQENLHNNVTCRKNGG